MALWIILGVFAFVVGTFMSLQPSAKEKALGRLREEGRKLELNPRVVACPDWLINTSGEKGKGMVALYGIILPEAKLPYVEAQIIDGAINVVNADNSVRHILHGEPFPMTQDKQSKENNSSNKNDKSNEPNEDISEITGGLGLSLQANFIGLYWSEPLPKHGQDTAEVTVQKLKNIKENLQLVAEKVQAKRNLA